MAQGGVQANANVVPANAFGAEVYQGLGDVGKAAFAVVAQAEERKADLERATMLMTTENKAKTAYADNETKLLTSPDSLSHESNVDEWTKQYNDQALSEINDPIVKRAAVGMLGNMRGGAVVQARHQARTMATSEAVAVTNETIDMAIDNAARSGMDPGKVKESLDVINMSYDGLVNGVGVDVNVAHEHRKKKLEEFWTGAAEAKIRVDPNGVRDLLNKTDDPMVAQMRSDLGPKAFFTLQEKALHQVVYNETLIETALKLRSGDNKAALFRMMSKAQSPADFTAIQGAIDGLFSPADHNRKGLDAGDAVWLQQAIKKQQEEGMPSDPFVVAQLEYQIYQTRGSGVSLDTLYGRLGNGLNGKDVTRLAGLMESLQGKPAALSAAMATIEKAIMPGMLEDITHAHKVTYNLAVQELMTSTNYGNADPKTIRDVAFKIADRAISNKTMVGGSSVFKSVDDLNKALRAGKAAPGDADGFLREMPLPPKWDSWDKVSRDWRDGNIDPDLARSIHRRMFPQPLVKGKKK